MKKSVVIVGVLAVLAVSGIALYALTRDEADTRPVDAAPAGNMAAKGKQTDRISYLPPSTSGPFVLPSTSNSFENVALLISEANSKDGLAIYKLSALSIQCQLINAAIESGDLDSSEDADVARTLIKCQSLSEKYINDPIGQLQMAAEAGVIEAQVAYPALASQFLTLEEMVRDPSEVERYKNDSMRYLHQAATAGSVEALNELAHAYNQGALTKQNQAYAYAYMDVVNRTNLAPSAAQVLEVWGAQLTPDQRDAARVIADNLYQECCS